MKNTMQTLSALTIAAALALFTSACSNEDLIVEEQPSQTPVPAAEAPVCHFSIPASLISDGQTRAVEVGGTSISSTFSSDDKVYVFIKRDLGSSSIVATAHNGTDASLYLTPTDIKGSSCTLDGALTFFTVEDYQFVPFEPAVDDVVYLFYNFNNTTVDDPTFDSTGWDFTRQNGSINEDVYGGSYGHTYLATQGISAFDCAEARMVVTKVIGNATDGYSLSMAQYGNESLTSVRFAKRSSLFRQRLIFTDEEGEPIGVPTLERLSIYFEGGNYFVESYTPFSQYGAFYYTSELTLDEPIISSDGDVYFSLMFTMDNIDKPLVLVARDVEGNVYSVTKEVPEGGFKNGKYYYGDATLAWKKTVKPKVSGTSATPFRGRYSIEEDPVELELWGNSEDYYFRLVKNQGGTITLDNVHASGSLHQDLYSPFISQVTTENAQTISLVLTGDNSIECHSFWAILVYGDLKLSCTGSVATLTVTTTSAECCGISCWNYRSDGEFDVSFNEFYNEGELIVTDMLAASGYKVIRSARTANDDDHDFYVDSYTWTYTVMPDGI